MPAGRPVPATGRPQPFPNRETPALSFASSLVRACSAVEDVCAAFGRAAAWLLVPLVAAVTLTVVAAQLRLNVLLDWGTPLPLLGERLTGNGLLDVQWHLFLVLTLLGGAYALRTDAHVSVDVLAARFGPRTKALVRFAGDLLFLVPFCALMTWFSYDFAVRAFVSGEASSYGGLVDRWIIKAVLPLGFGLLTLMGAARAIRSVVEAWRPDTAPSETGN